ncbi:MAG: TetR/AcrR family transcriptional regulator, partial [Propionibacteriaceae bacterium]
MGTAQPDVRRRGRRPGSPRTREAILEVALEQFAYRGYTGTSLRGVAAAAGVDPSLV